MAPIVDEVEKREDQVDFINAKESDQTDSIATSLWSSWSTQTLVLVVILALFILVLLISALHLHYLPLRGGGSDSGRCPWTPSRSADEVSDNFWQELHHVATCSRASTCLTNDRSLSTLSSLTKSSIPEEGGLLTSCPSSPWLVMSPSMSSASSSLTLPVKEIEQRAERRRSVIRKRSLDPSCNHHQ